MFTITNSAELYVTTLGDQQADIEHVRNALSANNYEDWALHVPLSKPHTSVEKNDKKTPAADVWC